MIGSSYVGGWGLSSASTLLHKSYIGNVSLRVRARSGERSRGVGVRSRARVRSEFEYRARAGAKSGLVQLSGCA